MRRTRIGSHRVSGIRFPTQYLVLDKSTLLLGLLVLLTAGILWVFFSRYTAIQTILCDAEGEPCDAQVEAELMKFLGTPILTFQASSVETKILHSSPTIKKVDVQSRFPHTISVLLLMRQAAVRLSVPQAQVRVVSDEEGLIFRTSRPEDLSLPHIIATELGDLWIGQRVESPAIRTSITLAGVLQDHFVKFDEIIVGRDIRVRLSEGTIVLFSHMTDAEKKVPSLQRILSDVTMNTKPAIIDLRHEKPIIQFTQ